MYESGEQKMNLGDKVVYQIYPKSFKDSNGDGVGDICGIIEKLEYIKELGIDYLWLTPIFSSPQKDNGYDISDYYQIEPVYGTIEEVEELIREARQYNIGIMFDMVFNHTSIQHEWFQRALRGEEEYLDYYIFKEGPPDKSPTNWQSKFGGSAWEYVPSLKKWYLHLFDVTQADLNWENPRVREELKKVILFWKEKGIKGFRFDVVNLLSKPEIYRDDEIGDGRRFYTDGPKIHDYIKEMIRDTGIEDMFTVGEMSSTSLKECIRYTDPVQKELSMCFNFHHLKIDYKNGNKWEIMEPDWSSLKKLFESWQMRMQENHGWNALFWSNHDQPRIVSRFGNDEDYWKESAKMLATGMYLMRGTPYIYQGEEIGMKNPYYGSIMQYRDVESLNYYKILLSKGMTQQEVLRILSERSRDNGRTPMQWNSDYQAGFTNGVPWISIPSNYMEINVDKEKKDKDSILEYYKKLIRLRKEYKAISSGSIKFLEKENKDVIAYDRYDQGKEILVFCNLTAKNVKCNIPSGAGWKKLLGNYEESLFDKKNLLQPYETIVFEKEEVEEPLFFNKN